MTQGSKFSLKTWKPRMAPAPNSSRTVPDKRMGLSLSLYYLNPARIEPIPHTFHNTSFPAFHQHSVTLSLFCYIDG